jgi:hypothetical protein
MRFKQCLLTLAIALGCAGNSTTEIPRPPQDGVNVLFIGNSLTYVNTLPAIVSALADSAGVTKLNVGMVAFPDFNLEDHWSRGDALRAIQAGGWHFVVLQQGPSSVLANRAQLIRSAKQFNTEIRRTNARPALYMVWPTIDRQQDFPGASLSYRLAADSVDGMLFPVAEAWRTVIARDPSIALYSSDGLHPSPAGSYLAALVMFQQLYNRSPVGLPARLTLRITGSPTLQVSAQAAQTMQTAAAEANAQFGR